MSRSGVIATGPYHLEQMALAMRQSSLVGKRVGGMRDGIETARFLMCYNYRRREGAPVVISEGVSESMAMPQLPGESTTPSLCDSFMERT